MQNKCTDTVAEITDMPWLVNRCWKVLLIAFRCNFIDGTSKFRKQTHYLHPACFLRHSNVFGSKCEEKTKSAVDFTHIFVINL